MDIKVSIIVPVYNMEKYLIPCIESVINQTLKEIEVICIDDGSTDKSLEILRLYESKDSRIKVYSKPNSGYGHTINYGLDRSHGQYIAIVESDDYIDTKGVEILFHCAEKSKADYVRANYYEFGREERINDSLNIYPCNKVFSAYDELSIFYSIAISPWACIYKKEFLDSNNIRMNQTPGAAFQDNSWQFMVLLKAQRIVFIKEALYHYRLDNADSSINSLKKVLCIVDEKNHMDKKLNEYKINDSQVFKVYSKLIYVLYKWNYERVSGEFQYGFLLEWKREILRQRSKGYLNEELFEKNQWVEMEQIADETDTYFEETAKIYRMREVYQSTINETMYFEAFLDKVCNEKFIMFGTGDIAKGIVKLLREKEALENIICFCETKVNKKIFYDKPVYALENLSFSKDVLIVCATVEQQQKNIVKRMRNMGFLNILSIDEKLWRIGAKL